MGFGFGVLGFGGHSNRHLSSSPSFSIPAFDGRGSLSSAALSERAAHEYSRLMVPRLRGTAALQFQTRPKSITNPKLQEQSSMRGPVGPDLRAGRSNKVDLQPKAAISVSARRADPTCPCRQFCQFPAEKCVMPELCGNYRDQSHLD
jgi:hypothetical protein